MHNNILLFITLLKNSLINYIILINKSINKFHVNNNKIIKLTLCKLYKKNITDKYLFSLIINFIINHIFNFK